MSLSVCVCLTYTFALLSPPTLTTPPYVYICVCVSQVHVTVTFGHHGIEDSHKQASLKKRDPTAAAGGGRPAGAGHASDADGHGGGGFTMPSLPGLKTFSHFHIPNFAVDGEGEEPMLGGQTGASTSASAASSTAAVVQGGHGQGTPATPATAGPPKQVQLEGSKTRDLGGPRDPGRASRDRPPPQQMSEEQQNARYCVRCVTSARKHPYNTTTTHPHTTYTKHKNTPLDDDNATERRTRHGPRKRCAPRKETHSRGRTTSWLRAAPTARASSTATSRYLPAHVV